MIKQEIRVGISDMNTAFSPDKIYTVGLGSCIGIVLYDKELKLGGMAHIMLPDSGQFADVNNPLKFADLAIPMLLEEMQKMGSKKQNIIAKIAGGASMFNFADKKMNMDIGRRNSASVKQILDSMLIPLIREDIGGNKARTIILDTKTGIVAIKTIGMG
ncbi:MAG TPA: chemotaxis protein CheD, partial [Clostridiaceae bacterium]